MMRQFSPNLIRRTRRFYGAFLLATFTFLSPSLVSAQDFFRYIPDPVTSDTDLISFIQRVISLAVGVAGLIAVVVLVYNGIMYILSSGDEAKVEKATKGITYAVLGLIICFVSVLIVNFVLQNIIRASV